jgi:predicted RecA/RadA family phage recombinase
VRNFVQEGDHLEVTAPYAVPVGGGCKVGGIFGFAIAAIDNGARGNIIRKGVFTHAKATGASTNWADGGAVYWDDSAKLLTGVASGNTKIGYGIGAAATGDATGTVLLVPV